MQAPILTEEELTTHYVSVAKWLYEVSRTYFFLGRREDCQRLLRTSLHLLETEGARPEQRLKLLLLYGQVLLVEHLLTRGEADLLFAAIRQAQEIAEAVQDRQGSADALSLLGQAYCFTTTVASLQSGISPFAPKGEGRYDEELTRALAYQQQALTLREALHDSRGFSESLFQIGLVHERWQEYELAQEYYAKARQVAEQGGHLFEQSEPARHAALHALRTGSLDQALTFAQRALTLREAASFRPYQPLDHLLLRDIYQAKGDTTRAQWHAEKASTLAEEMGLTTLVASMPNIRNVLTGQGERE